MTEEIYKRYRPLRWSDVKGQPEACKFLEAKVKAGTVPHAILLTGPSGTGKTTLARILRTELKCGEADFTEINAADFRGIDMVREIRTRMGLAPMFGKCRIWLIDEAHALSKDAQSALLKMLEDTPKHVYFMLATTDPGKLLKTITNRCTEVGCKALKSGTMTELIKDVASKEKVKLSKDVIERLVEVADGSARKALVITDHILALDDEDEQLNTIADSDSKRQAIELCRALLNPRCAWADVVPILKGTEGEDVESLRHMVLGYATACMGSGNKGIHARSYLILTAFRDNFFDSKRSGLYAACYEVIQGA